MMIWKSVELRGKPFRIHPLELFSLAIERNGDFWEADILDYLRDNYPEQKTIVDVGANIGNHTVYFARFLKYDAIYAFEPIAENYILLSTNIFFNIPHFKDKIFSNFFALSDDTKVVKMTANLGNMGASQIEENGLRSVPTCSLDSLGLTNVSLLKIDAEWHEPQILAGARKTIERDKPLILIEDTLNQYRFLLPPSYVLLKDWGHHNTYLYGVLS